MVGAGSTAKPTLPCRGTTPRVSGNMSGSAECWSLGFPGFTWLGTGRRTVFAGQARQPRSTCGDGWPHSSCGVVTNRRGSHNSCLVTHVGRSEIRCWSGAALTVEARIGGKWRNRHQILGNSCPGGEIVQNAG